MIPALIAPLMQTIGTVIDRIIPDTAAAAQAKTAAQLEVLKLAQAGELAQLESATKVIVAEAQGEGWLQRNWRPLVMLNFAALITARWLGLSAPGIDQALEMKLFDIVQLGLGGYVIGRSAEKIAATLRPGAPGGAP
jgi:hypothetical protein